MKFDTIDVRTKHKVDIIVSDIPNYKHIKQDIIKLIDNEVDPHNKKTNLKCHMTKWDMTLHPSFSTISDYACELCTSYTLLKKDHKRLFSTGACWGARYTGEEYAREHDHYPATWSGVAFIDCPEGSGELIFPTCDYKYKPQNGKMIIVPSYLRHKVEPSGEGVRRYIVAYNIVPAKYL
tara:strand:- start:41 stop:577 length:537 start_codon:yes stop_codon:yes gene_type:complete